MVLVARSRRRIAALVALVALAGVLGVSPVHADPVCTITWGGGVSNDWGSGLNWSENRAPVASDVVCIPTGSETSHDPRLTGASEVTVVRASRPVTINGGTLTITSTTDGSSFADLRLTSGNLEGAADVTATLLTQSGGAMNGTGTTTVTGAFTLAGGNLGYDRTLDTQGPGTWTGGTYYGYDDAVWNNSGTLSITADGGSLIDYSYATGDPGAPSVLHNTGTITKTSGAGDNDVSLRLDNDGAVTRTGGGKLRFVGGGSGSTGTFGDTVLANGDFTTGAVTFNDTTINGGIVTVDGTSTGTGLTLASGALNGSGDVTLGTLTQSGGAMNGTGTTTVTGAFTLAGGNLGYDRTLDTQGPGTWTGGTYYGYDDAVWNNSGTLSITADGGSLIDYSYATGDPGAPSVLHNTGTITKTSGAGDNDVSLRLDNDGAVTRTGGGKLRFVGGGSGSTGTFGDTVLANGDFTTGAVTFNDTTINGGIVTVDGTSTGTGLTLASGALNGSGDVTLGTLTQSGGAMNGTGTTTVTGAFTLAGGNLGYDRTLDTQGPGTWTGGTYYGYDDAVWNNSGTLSITADGGSLIDYSYATGDPGAPSVLHNTGTITKTSGAGDNDVSLRLDNDGAVTRTGGGKLRFVGGGSGSTGTFGDTVLANGDFTTGAVTFNDTTINGGIVTVDGTSTGTGLTLASGALNGSGDVTLGTLTQSGGAMNGTGTTTVTGAFTLAGGNLGYDRTLDTQGPGTWTGGTYYGYDDAVWNNSGTLSITADGGSLIDYSYATGDPGAPSVLHNTGTITKTSGAGDNHISPLVDNDGTIKRTGGGRLLLTGGGTGTSSGTFGTELAYGTFTLDGAAGFDGAVIAGATVRLDRHATTDAHDLELRSGTLVTGAGLDLTGSFVFSGGSLDARAGTLIEAGADTTVTLTFGTISGDPRLETAGATTLGGFQTTSVDRLVWENTGTVTMSANAAVSAPYGKLVNRGTLVAPAATYGVLNMTVVNDGALRIPAEALHIANFRQTTDGALETDVTTASTTPKLYGDRISYSGDLVVTTSTGYAPAEGARTELLGGPHVDGEFRSTTGLDLGDRGSLSFEMFNGQLGLVGHAPAPRSAAPAAAVAPAADVTAEPGSAPAPASATPDEAPRTTWTLAVAPGARIRILSKPRGLRVRHDRRADVLRVRATRRARGRLVLRYRIVRPDGRTRTVTARLRR